MRFHMTKLVAASAAAAMLAAGPALAVTITNNSDKAHEVTIDLGEQEPKSKIEAGKSAKLDCPEGCEVRVTGVGYGLPGKTGEKLVIGKDGMLAYAGQAAQTEATKKDGKAK